MDPELRLFLRRVARPLGPRAFLRFVRKWPLFCTILAAMIGYAVYAEIHYSNPDPMAGFALLDLSAVTLENFVGVPQRCIDPEGDLMPIRRIDASGALSAEWAIWSFSRNRAIIYATGAPHSNPYVFDPPTCLCVTEGNVNTEKNVYPEQYMPILQNPVTRNIYVQFSESNFPAPSYNFVGSEWLQIMRVTLIPWRFRPSTTLVAFDREGVERSRIPLPGWRAITDISPDGRRLLGIKQARALLEDGYGFAAWRDFDNGAITTTNWLCFDLHSSRGEALINSDHISVARFDRPDEPPQRLSDGLSPARDAFRPAERAFEIIDIQNSATHRVLYGIEERRALGREEQPAGIDYIRFRSVDFEHHVAIVLHDKEYRLLSLGDDRKWIPIAKVAYGGADPVFIGRGRLAVVQPTGIEIVSVDELISRLRESGQPMWETKRNGP